MTEMLQMADDDKTFMEDLFADLDLPPDQCLISLIANQYKPMEEHDTFEVFQAQFMEVSTFYFILFLSIT